MAKAKDKPHALLVVDKNYLPIALKLLDQAKETVDVIAYSFAIAGADGNLAPAGAPYKIAQKLIAIKQRGGKSFRVRVFLEGRRDTAERNQMTAKFLQKGGVEICFGSTHAKGFCIDQRSILFGSTNLSNQSILKNNETNVFWDNLPVAGQMTRYFEHLWSGGGHGDIALKPPMYADGDFLKILLKLIDSAKTSLQFSIYFFYHEKIEEALMRAHRRGVNITGFIHQHASFALSYVHRTRAAARRLEQAGIKNLRFGPKNLFTHSKYMIVDQKRLLLGTGNWIEEDVTTHPQLYLLLADAKLCLELSRHLQQQMTEQGSR